MVEVPSVDVLEEEIYCVGGDLGPITAHDIWVLKTLENFSFLERESAVLRILGR